ncbi:chitobiase/beta-hexosaminidase C-terminal domain-containing protein [Echinicola sediminis]
MNIRNNLRGWLENLLIVFTGLIIIFLIGGDRLEVPALLQVAGRSHPLILHFPIVLMVIALVFVLVPRILPTPYQQQMARWSLLFATFFAGITVLTGWVLSHEEGYEGDNLVLHKWLGLAVFFLALLVYFMMDKWPKMQKGMSLTLLLVLIGAGHWGANLTHGTDFLLEPVQAKNSAGVPLEEAEVYTHLVKPILEQKCINCHQSSKSKGELRLDEVAMIQKGGKNGSLFDTANWDKSLFIERLLLPKEEKKHMPPKGKPQLSPEELEILKIWVQEGASFEGRVADKGEESPMYQLASLQLEKEEPYDFEAADPKKVEELNNFYRVVKPIYPESPALEISYFGAAAFDPSSFDELKKVKEQVVSFNLNRMPLKGVDLSFLKDFSHLEDLKLNFCGLEAGQLEVLASLPKLRAVSLVGNDLDQSVFKTLVNSNSLEYLFLWSTGLSEEHAAEFLDKRPHVEVEWGYEDEGVVYQLNSPQIKYKKEIIDGEEEVEIKHPIGSVEIFYTLDGSAPDSINSLRYEKPILLDNTSAVKAVAFAKGWQRSEAAEAYLYKAGFTPKEVELRTKPSGNYQGDGVKTLFDLKKGDSNYASGAWLGFKDEPMILDIGLSDGQKVGTVALSMMYHEEAHIFPPLKVEIMAQKAGGWTTVASEKFEVPERSGRSRMAQLIYQMDSKVSDKLRIKITPNPNLPAWFRGAGDKGWVFLDEVVLN